jgi:hypothetical protein
MSIRALTILASTFALFLVSPLHAESRPAQTEPVVASKLHQPRVEKMIRAFARRAEALRGRPLIAKADLPRR